MSGVKLIEVLTDDEYFLNRGLQEVIEALNEKLNMIPDEYKGLAILDVEGIDDYGGLSVSICYERPKTLDEINQENEAERQRQINRVNNARDRYFELKKQFGHED